MLESLLQLFTFRATIEDTFWNLENWNVLWEPRLTRHRLPSMIDPRHFNRYAMDHSIICHYICQLGFSAWQNLVDYIILNSPAVLRNMPWIFKDVSRMNIEWSPIIFFEEYSTRAVFITVSSMIIHAWALLFIKNQWSCMVFHEQQRFVNVGGKFEKWRIFFRNDVCENFKLQGNFSDQAKIQSLGYNFFVRISINCSSFKP